MSKRKIVPNITYWFMSHPWLKLIALALAVIIWLYVNSEITISRIYY